METKEDSIELAPIDERGPYISISGEEAIQPSQITMHTSGNEIIKLCANGDIYINGRLAENDLAVVEGMRIFLNHAVHEHSRKRQDLGVEFGYWQAYADYKLYRNGVPTPSSQATDYAKSLCGDLELNDLKLTYGDPTVSS